MRKFLRRFTKTIAILAAVIFAFWIFYQTVNQYFKAPDEITLDENQRYDMKLWLDTSLWRTGYSSVEDAISTLASYIDGDEYMTKYEAEDALDAIRRFTSTTHDNLNKAMDLIDEEEKERDFD